MKIRFECIGLALVAALGVAAARDGSGGYLATVGPAALRFQALPSPAPVLPPLDSADKPPSSLVSELGAVNGEEAKTQQPAPATGKSDGKNGAIPDMAANSSDQPGMITTAPAGPDSAVTPQMFLRFFAQPTNSGESSIVVVPLRFAPAQPAVRSSSSAQYSAIKQ